MRIRVLGAGIYGCHLAVSLIAEGHTVEVHDIADRVFAGASGNNPARLHLGQHYPRSGLTRSACQEHTAEFMRVYGHLTRAIPINIYAIAERDSLVDFATYRKVLKDEIEFITISDPSEFGLRNVEGAILTGERHIVADLAKNYFEKALDGHLVLNSVIKRVNDGRWDLTIDCSFCANDEENIDRYEPCLTVLLEGQVDRSTTIMDGQMPGLYVWNEDYGLSSLTSASLTPLSKTCRTWREARDILDRASQEELNARANAMMDQICGFWPAVRDLYQIVDFRLAIRAMPKSAADARLVDVVRVGDRSIRVRAGKMDAIFHAERRVKGMIRESHVPLHSPG